MDYEPTLKFPAAQAEKIGLQAEALALADIGFFESFGYWPTTEDTLKMERDGVFNNKSEACAAVLRAQAN